MHFCVSRRRKLFKVLEAHHDANAAECKHDNEETEVVH